MNPKNTPIKHRSKTAQKAYAENLMKISHILKAQFFVVCTSGLLYVIFEKIGNQGLSPLELLNLFMDNLALQMSFITFEVVTLYGAYRHESEALNILDGIDEDFISESLQAIEA